MLTKFETFIKQQKKENLPDIKSGDTVKVYQKIPARIATPARQPNSSHGGGQSVAGGKEKHEEKTQIFEGLVLARKHGSEMGSTIIVRKEISGIGVERTFPLHSPMIEKIEIIKRGKARRAKLYYLRTAQGQRARLKEKKKK